MIIKVVEDRGKCTRRSAQIASRNVKFLSNQVATVPSTVNNAFRNVKRKAVKKIGIFMQ